LPPDVVNVSGVVGFFDAGVTATGFFADGVTVGGFSVVGMGVGVVVGRTLAMRNVFVAVKSATILLNSSDIKDGYAEMYRVYTMSSHKHNSG